MNENKIINNDCLFTLREFAEDSIDLIVTDPPYGISFLSEDWDTFNEIVNPQEAYASKKGFKKLPRNKPFNMQEFFIPIWKECLRVLKPGGWAFIMCSPRQDVMCEQIMALKNAGFEIGYTSLYWTFSQGFPKAMNIAKAVTAKEKTGGSSPQKLRQIRMGENYSPIGQVDYKKGRMFEHLKSDDCKTEISETGKQFEGAFTGFSPKPAIEVILIAMKPLSERTYIAQAIKDNKGITWLGNGRIPYISEEDKNNATPQGKCTSGPPGQIGARPSLINKEQQEFERPELKGRFPSNLLVSDDILNNNEIKKYGNKDVQQITYGDSGSYSRYFDLDIWFEKQLEQLPENVRKVLPFLICSKASTSEKNKGLKGKGDNINIHPTVKPLALMSWLITIGSRKHDIVLDPFVGSGTTCISAKMLNRKYIGIEKEEKYFRIAEQRIKVFDLECPLLELIENEEEEKI